MKEYKKMKTIALLSCCALFISCNNGIKNKAGYFGEDISQNVHMERKYAPEISKYPDAKSMYMAHPEYLQAALNQIKQNHGSVEDYLKNILNVDMEKMKDLYLYNNL